LENLAELSKSEQADWGFTRLLILDESEIVSTKSSCASLYALDN